MSGPEGSQPSCSARTCEAQHPLPPQTRHNLPRHRPFHALGHIYYDPEFESREMRLYRTPLSLLASDHLPLIATISL